MGKKSKSHHHKKDRHAERKEFRSSGKKYKHVPRGHGSPDEDYTIFRKWPDVLSAEPDQFARICRAADEDLKVLSYNKKTGKAKVQGLTGDYTTSLDGCSCADFERRGLPCKHMYKLAGHLHRIDLNRIAHSKAVQNGMIEYHSMHSAAASKERKTYDIPEGDHMALRPYGAEAYYVLENGIQPDIRAKFITYGDDPEKAFLGMLSDFEHLVPGSVHEMVYERPHEDEVARAIEEYDITIPKECCREDLLCLMERKETNDPAPDSQLMQFCKEHRITYSLYTGEKRLERTAFDGLKTRREKVAFVIALEIRRKYGIWELDHWDNLMSFTGGLLMVVHGSFMESFDQEDPLNLPDNTDAGRIIRAAADTYVITTIHLPGPDGGVAYNTQMTKEGIAIIPKEVREALGVSVGGRVAFVVHGDSVQLVRSEDLESTSVSE